MVRNSWSLPSLVQCSAAIPSRNLRLGEPARASVNRVTGRRARVYPGVIDESGDGVGCASLDRDKLTAGEAGPVRSIAASALQFASIRRCS